MKHFFTSERYLLTRTPSYRDLPVENPTGASYLPVLRPRFGFFLGTELPLRQQPKTRPAGIVQYHSTV